MAGDIEVEAEERLEGEDTEVEVKDKWKNNEVEDDVIEGRKGLTVRPRSGAERRILSLQRTRIGAVGSRSRARMRRMRSKLRSRTGTGARTRPRERP